MLIDRTHRQWALLSAVIMAVATGCYMAFASHGPKGPTGGSWWGLMFGVVGTLMMIFAGLLAGRKQVPHWRLGSAQFWLRGHIWLGALSLPMILFHSGFGLGGTLEMTLWTFFAVVIASGFFGLLMQHFLPQLITYHVPRETFITQLPYIRRRARVLCDKVVSEDCGRIPLAHDDLRSQLEVLGKHAEEVRSAPKDEAKKLKEQWAERLAPDNRTLFTELAAFAKASKWITREDDFTTHLLEIYAFPGQGGTKVVEAVLEKSADNSFAPRPKAAKIIEGGRTARRAAEAEGMSQSGSMSGEKRLSPLEMMKLKQALRKLNDESGSGVTPAADVFSEDSSIPLGDDDSSEDFGGEDENPEGMTMMPRAHKSPDLMAALAALSDDSESPSKSPMARARAQAEKKAALSPAKPAADAAAAKPMSPLEMMKAKAAAAKAANEGGAEAPAAASAPAAEAKPMSPLEMMKAKAAAAKAAKEGGAEAPAAAPAPAAEAKPMSPLEMMKAKAAAAKAAKEGGAEAPAAAPAPAADAKPMSPLEMMKAKAAAAKAGGAETPAAAPAAAKPLSPLEQMKAKAAGATPAAAAAPAAPKPAPPAPVAIVKKPVAVKSQILRTEELHHFYTSAVRPYLSGSGREGQLGDIITSNREFTRMREVLPIELHDALLVLQEYVDEHRQYAKLERIHHWLHYWLALHIPVSLALFVLVIVHVLVALRVVPWSFDFRI